MQGAKKMRARTPFAFPHLKARQGADIGVDCKLPPTNVGFTTHFAFCILHFDLWY